MCKGVRRTKGNRLTNGGRNSNRGNGKEGGTTNATETGRGGEGDGIAPGCGSIWGTPECCVTKGERKGTKGGRQFHKKQDNQKWVKKAKRRCSSENGSLNYDVRELRIDGTKGKGKKRLRKKWGGETTFVARREFLKKTSRKRIPFRRAPFHPEKGGGSLRWITKVETKRKKGN